LLDIKNEFLNSNIKNDILSAFVVSMVLIPEAIVFCVIAGISPLIGLYTACILGIVTALIGGKAGVISGLTGAIAVTFLALSVKIQESIPSNILEELSENGELSTMLLQYILLATILAGILQVLFGVFKIAKYIQLVPIYVLFGLVNGLAIIMIVAQFYTFKNESYLYYSLVILTVLVVIYLPKLSKAIPASLIALIVGSFVVIYFDLDTKRVGDLANLSSSVPFFSIPKIYINFEVLISILPYSLLLAFISSLESLLTMNVLDQMQQKQGNANQECIATGAGNIVCGFFGAVAGSSMLGQSVLNYSNNAFGRVSTLLVPLLLIAVMLFFSEFIALIPVSILIGILITIPIFLIKWQNRSHIKQFSNFEKILIVLVSAITVFVNLEVAFILAISIAFVLYLFKQFTIKSRVYMQDNEKVYELHGPLHNYNTSTFLQLFDVQQDPKEIIIDFKYARIIDQGAIEAIDKIAEIYKQNKKNIRIKYLSSHCKKALNEALYCCEYNEDDPSYGIAIDVKSKII